jgi:hypothetical protein
VTKSADVKLLPKVLWLMLALFALVNGLGALRYLLPHVPFPAEVDNFSQRRIALRCMPWVARSLTAGVALSHFHPERSKGPVSAFSWLRSGGLQAGVRVAASLPRHPAFANVAAADLRGRFSLSSR